MRQPIAPAGTGRRWPGRTLAVLFETLEGRRLLSLTTPDPTFAGGKGVSLLNADGSANDSIAVLPNHQIIALGGYSVAKPHHNVLDGFEYVGYDSAGKKLYDRRVPVGKFNAAGRPGGALAITAAAAPDGKLVLGGYLPAHHVIPPNHDRHIYIAVVRVNPVGTPDASFQPLQTNFTQPAYFGVVAVQSDGKVLVGYTGAGLYEVMRYNADGSPDDTFGGSYGVVGNFTHTDATSTVTSLLVQPDGKILVGGGVYVYASNKHYFAIARYNADGTADTSFGTDGNVLTDFGGYARVESLHAERNGRFCAVGTSSTAVTSDVGRVVVVRYMPSGRLDPTFGHRGKIFAAEDYTPTTVPNQVALGDDSKLYEVVNDKLIRLMGLASTPPAAVPAVAAPVIAAPPALRTAIGPPGASATLFGTTPITDNVASDRDRGPESDFA